MYGRFTLHHTREEIEAQFETEAEGWSAKEQAEGQAAEPLEDARYNIAPTQNVLAVVQSQATSPRHLASYHWGLIPSWAKDPAIGNKMIHARAEPLIEKPSFRTALVRRRCLIPADGHFMSGKPETTRPRPRSTCA